jgi:F0F1-type ATP synthase assembly protein I
MLCLKPHCVTIGWYFCRRYVLRLEFEAAVGLCASVAIQDNDQPCSCSSGIGGSVTVLPFMLVHVAHAKRQSAGFSCVTSYSFLQSEALSIIL